MYLYTETILKYQVPMTNLESRRSSHSGGWARRAGPHTGGSAPEPRSPLEPAASAAPPANPCTTSSISLLGYSLLLQQTYIAGTRVSTTPFIPIITSHKYTTIGQVLLRAAIMILVPQHVFSAVLQNIDY